jgi:hypothetical protein
MLIGVHGGNTMQAILRVVSPAKIAYPLAAMTLVAGASGMAVSFLFLASAHYLDVIAGAAGFISGSILAAGGLISISFQMARLRASEQCTIADEALAAIKAPFDVRRWMAHFRRNKENRSEPNWSAPITLPVEVARPLVRSLEQFQLGDGGGPAYLIARDREKFLADGQGTRELVDLWFAEEREHARLLGAAIARFGGHCILSHWSFTAFCMSRKWFGVRFELTVLLLTEIVSTVYYKLLRRHGQDPALRSMCRLIIRDEKGHVAFHRDRLARTPRGRRGGYGIWWESRFRLLGLAAASMLWVNHSPGLRAIGANGAEFYREVWMELSQFVHSLRRASEEGAQAELPPANFSPEVIATQIAATSN